MHLSTKILFWISKIKGRGREKLILIARYYKIGKDNWIDSNSFRDGNFLTKIKLWMHLNIYNAHTNFQFSICNNVDVIRRKPILYCHIYNIEGGLEMGDNSFALNSFTVWNFSTTILKLHIKFEFHPPHPHEMDRRAIYSLGVKMTKKQRPFKKWKTNNFN